MPFAVIAPFPELAAEIKEVCKDLNYDVQIAIGDLNEGLREAEKILQNSNKIEAIVSRGGTAKLIEANFDIPVIFIEISTFDVIRAIVEAKQYGNKIGVIGFKDIVSGAKELGTYLGAEVYGLEYSSEKEVPEVIKKAEKQGIDIIVGDHSASSVGEKLGIKTIRMCSGKEAIAIALKKAKELANVRKVEKVKAEELRTILETTHGGIITTNRDGVITLINTAAEKMLLKNKVELIGKSIYTIANRKSIQQVMSSGEAYIGEIYKNDKGIIVQSISPILIDNEIQGLVISMNDAKYVESVEIKVRKELYSKGYIAKYNFSDIVTNNNTMKNTIKQAYHYAQSDLTVLIIGESGTGKEMIAQSIHNASKRRNGPFIAINSAVMPENLLESELFGYEEGAFTGARKGGKKGLFELAHNGTLFLDEIGEMPLNLQSRLLRVLQEKSIMRVGGDKVISINTRIIAATHVDLRKAVEEGKFRRDLYYRLNVLNIRVPSLKERKEDIPDLVHILNERISKELGIIPPIYSSAILNYLSDMDWQGNVRQVENIISRIAVLFSGEKITIENLNEVLDINQTIEQKKTPKLFLDLDKLQAMDLNIIKKTMELTNNDKEKTCEILGISKTTLWRKIKKL